MPRRHPRYRDVASRVTNSLRGYRTVLSSPGVVPVALSSLVARLPKGMVPLALVLLLHDGNGGYAVAGLAVAATAIGDAISSPWQGRLMDRHGHGRVLMPTVGLHTVAGAVLLNLPDNGRTTVPTVICAALLGIGMPPVSAAIKAIWPRMVGPDRASAAYGLESLIQQIMFSIGPLLVTVFALLAPASSTLVASMSLTVVGTGWFVRTARSFEETAWSGAPGSATPVRRVRPERPVVREPLVVLLCLCTLLQGITFGALPVALTAAAAAAGVPAMVGVLQAGTSIGGLAGTFAMTPIGRPAEFVRSLGGFAAALALPVVLSVWPSAPTLAVLAGVLVIPGLFLTPLAAGSYLLLDRGIHPANRTEAFTWLSTSLALGTAIGAGLAGVLVDVGGAPLALGLAPAAVVVAAVLARRIPA